MSSGDTLIVKPIGGVGQIGGNMTLVFNDDDGIIIDAGILFPRDKNLGIKCLYPNFYHYLDERFQSVFLTHSHEDHIGAVKELFKFNRNLHIYCSRFCYEILKQKVEIPFEQITLIKDNQVISIGNMSITAVPMDHSTPQTMSFYVETQTNGVFFSSDFKFNHNSKKTMKALTSLAPNFKSKKNLCAFLDSTSIKSKNFTPVESELKKDLLTVLDTKKRITVTLFASNVERMKTIIEAAFLLKKKVYLFGRSIHFYYQAAIASGEIVKSSHVYDIDQYNSKDQNVIIIVSGCQGDYRSTLNNISKNQVSHYQVSENDLIVFSSSIIPGNERQVQMLYNRFIELGADIITYKDFLIHCSGHPSSEDIKLLTSFLPMTHHFPIHGESFLLKHHHYFAKNDLNLNSFLISDFDEVELSNEVKVYNIDTLDDPTTKPIILSEGRIILDKTTVNQRRKLAEHGIIIYNLASQGITEYGSAINDDQISSLEKSLNNFIRKNRPSKDEIRIHLRAKVQKLIFEKVTVLVV